jgi:peptidoglycan/LPS O-acetylase OafA/YrhL
MPALIGGSEKERLIGLDLLRALAILGVLSAHYAYPLLRKAEMPGWIIAWSVHFGEMGVELFFALSGFLIGSLLLEIVERDPSLRSWFTFLVRRWMRTLPLYFLWVILLMVFWPPERELALHSLKYFTFTQNLAWPMPKGNWFGVSWSLAVEEWFYLLFSTILLALSAWTRRWTVLLACGVFVAVPLFLRISIGPIDGSMDLGFRKIVVFRLDAIAYGVLIAWLYRHWQVAMRILAYPLLALGLLFVIVTVTHGTILPDISLFYVLLPFGFSLMMPWATQIHIGSSSLSAAIRWLSTRSYCIYIIHVTLLKMCGNWFGHFGAKWFGHFGAKSVVVLMASLICALLAELSYRYFEMPILKRRPPQFSEVAVRRSRSEFIHAQEVSG